jgi:hypothetical protein
VVGNTGRINNLASARPGLCACLEKHHLVTFHEVLAEDSVDAARMAAYTRAVLVEDGWSDQQQGPHVDAVLLRR